MKKRCILLLLSLVLVLSCMAVPTEATNGEGRSYEVALLIDASGSMNWADPGRISIEAAKSFAQYHPAEAEYFKVSVILYNTNILAALKSVDVKTETGMNRYIGELNKIGALKKGEKYNGFSVWTGDTDIGSAIVEADKILSASSAKTKSVILFTDGKIDLDNSNFNVTTEAEKKSKENALSCAEKFGKAGIPMYTVGLNYNNGVDKAFMQQLADMTGGQFASCTTADEVQTLFSDMYAYFVGGTSAEPDQEVIRPDVETDYSLQIYGQAISQADLNLFSPARIATFSVRNPQGVEVARGEADGNVKNLFPNNCIIYRDEMQVNIKLVNPADGKWTVSFTGKEQGTIQIHKIFLYELRVENEFAPNITVGDKVTFQPVLYNEDTDSRITTQAVYKNSTCTITLTKDGKSISYPAKLNSASNGFVLDVPMNEPGEYQVEVLFENEQFQKSGMSVLTVLPPDLVLSTDDTICQQGNTMEFTAQVTDSTGAPMNLPGYLTGGICKAEIKCDGKTVANINGTAKGSGKYAFTYKPTVAGKYEVTVQISYYDDAIYSAKPLSFTVWQPELSVEVAVDKVPAGGSISASAFLINPATGEKLSIGSYLVGKTLEAEIKLNGSSVAKLPVKITASGISFQYTPEKAGTYTISLTGQNFVAKEVSFTVWSPELKLEIAEDKVPMGGSFSATVSLTNPTTGEKLPISSALVGKTLEAEIKLDGNSVAKLPVKITDAGISFTYTPDKAGTYTVVLSGQDFASTEASFVVWSPELKLEMTGDKLALGETMKPVVTLINPATGEKLSVSDYLSGVTLEAEIKLNGQSVAKLPVEITDSGITFDYKPEQMGSYTIIVSGGEFASKEVNFTVDPSTISVKGEVEDVTGSVLFDELQKEIELGSIFKDSDGDKLKYEVSFDGEGVEVAVEDGVLILKAKGGAKGTVTVKVTDGRGAEQTLSFGVSVESMMTLFIMIVVVVVLIIIAIPVVIIILKKRSIPRIKYRIRVLWNPTTEGKEAVYEINRASNNRRAKPVMTVKEILDTSTLTSEITSELTEEEYREVLYDFATRISVTGFAFKDGLKIQLPDGKTKVFTSAIATIQLKSSKPDNENVVQFSFGKTSAL